MKNILKLFLIVLLFGAYLTAVYWLIRPYPTNTQATLFTGITYTRRAMQKPRPIMLHIVEIDLTQEGIQFVGTTGDLSLNPEFEFTGQTTGSFLQRVDAQLAINGGFFFPFHAKTVWNYYPKAGEPVDVNGLSIANGIVYSPERNRYSALCINGTNVSIMGTTCPASTEQAVAGRPVLIRNGCITPRLQDGLAPRTAIALSADNKTMWIVVVDGRQRGYSEGVTLAELAELLHDLGAHTALNLDGGGSSTLVIQENGRLKTLNAPFHTRVPMRQRPVANHLGIYALPAGN